MNRDRREPRDRRTISSSAALELPARLAGQPDPSDHPPGVVGDRLVEFTPPFWLVGRRQTDSRAIRADQLMRACSATTSRIEFTDSAGSRTAIAAARATP